jgi:hypothetical protein
VVKLLAVTQGLSAEGVLVRTPRSVRRSVWTGNDYSVAVRIPHPALPVIGPAVTISRVSMTRQHRLDAHFSGALHNRFKIVDLEPQQHPVSIWLVVTIANPPVMMFHLEAVQLKDKLPVRDQLFICGAPMIAPAAEQTLVPSAARFHIGHGDQRLRTHSASLSFTLPRWRPASGDSSALGEKSNGMLLLEQELNRQLHQAWRAGLQNLAERGRFQIVFGQSQIGMVEQVEALRPELHTFALAKLEILEQR